MGSIEHYHFQHAMVFLFISLVGKKKPQAFHQEKEQVYLSRIIELSTVPPPPSVPPAVLPVKPASGSLASTAEFKVFKIVPDPEASHTIPSIDDQSGKMISHIDADDEMGNNQSANTGNIPSGPGTNHYVPDPPEPKKEIIFSRSEPEFPGGRAALENFLHRHLRIPDALQIGDKKTVQVKFKITPEGAVSDIQIVKSGGEQFDKEVIRVCKKMPKWKPATQNGINIPVSFVLPVTFIAYEQ